MFGFFDSWLSFHIFSVLTASAAYLAGAVFGVLLLRKSKKGSRSGKSKWAFLNSSESLDELSRRMLLLGTVLWGLGGIIGGAMFSQAAWNRYWSWEPKETMTLVTFFFYLFYFITAYLLKWEPSGKAKLAIAGFAVVLFTALGAEALLGGLHSFQTAAFG